MSWGGVGLGACKQARHVVCELARALRRTQQRPRRLQGDCLKKPAAFLANLRVYSRHDLRVSPVGGCNCKQLSSCSDRRGALAGRGGYAPALRQSVLDRKQLRQRREIPQARATPWPTLPDEANTDRYRAKRHLTCLCHVARRRQPSLDCGSPAAAFRAGSLLPSPCCRRTAWSQQAATIKAARACRTPRCLRH